MDFTSPVRIAGLKIDLDHMPPQANGNNIIKAVRGNRALFNSFYLLLSGKDGGNTLCSNIFFGNNQMHDYVSFSSRRAFKSAPNVFGSARPRVSFMT